MQVPLIDIKSLFDPEADHSQVIEEISTACRDIGFFYICGHGVNQRLQHQLEQLSKRFFQQPEDKKMEISMDRAGKAWRGYFPVEGELTSGKPDVKEGLYFSEDLPEDHPSVVSGLPLHGSNLYPDIPGFRQVIRDYLQNMSTLAGVLMRALSRGLKLDEDYLSRHLMVNPIKLFRIFHYPVPTSRQKSAEQWGVGEHTDYGMLTILKQDRVGGLQILSQDNWIDAPFIEDSFICNIGDMLDYVTGGYYRSTPHRVFNMSDRGRISYPYFYDLDFTAVPRQIDLSHLGHREIRNYHRWDQSDLHAYRGTYGKYLVDKISKVFPQLRENVL